MLGIRWDDFVSNAEVLERTGSVKIEILIEKSQLRWLGHVRRMNECELPKIALYGELARGCLNSGGQKKRYKDHVRALLEKIGILANWEQLANDRVQWRKRVSAH